MITLQKSARKIFQPNTLTNSLIEEFCLKDNNNISDFVNIAITYYFTPVNKHLRKETDRIFSSISKNEEITAEELQATLARCVAILKNYPLEDSRPLEEIFVHFVTKRIRALRYDYIQIVDTWQDEQLHRLNDILKTLDRDYNLGTRELGERSRAVFEHWNELCNFPEIYTLLATIITCENIYYPLDPYRTIHLIKQLDLGVQASYVEPSKTPFKTEISLRERYYGIRYEVSVYHTDNGYCELSGDTDFLHMSNEIKEYYQEYMRTYIPDEITQEDVEKIQNLEKKGRFLFRRLSKEKHA